MPPAAAHLRKQKALTLTLLLDLDDTLLGNSMESFVPAYLQALARCLSPYTEPTQMVQTLLAATRQMVKNTLPGHTLEKTFDAAFYPPLGLQKESLRTPLDAFYTQEFPKLRPLTQARAEAIRLVETAFERGYRVAIANNPLFPRTAILQWLEWAGLPVERYPFALIPSYETFHFAKPNPAYLHEFLAQMGWPEGPMVMVGDDLENDIIPARKAGLAAYWVPQTRLTPPVGVFAPSGVGTLTELIDWLETTPETTFQPDFDQPPALLATLHATPGALHTLCSQLTPQDWRARPSPNDWSLVEILCHLRDVDAEVNLPRLQTVLNQTNPFLAGKDTDPWSETRQYIQQDGPQALQIFTDARSALLALLQSLPDDAWMRPARHAIFGPTTLQELVYFITGHDRLHVRQARETTYH